MTASTMAISSSMSGLSTGSTARHLVTTSLTASLILTSGAGLASAAAAAEVLAPVAERRGGLAGAAVPLGPSSGKRQSPPRTQRERVPPVSSERISKGDLPTRQAKRVQPRDQ